MDFYCKKTGAYSQSSNEAIENAHKAWSILGGRGWTINAFVGFWANVGAESGYNPWRWQGDNVRASNGYPWKNIGYGFTQFTPAKKYISDSKAQAINGFGPNFSNRVGSVADGHAQLLFVDQYADYIPTSRFPMSYAEFKRSVQSAEDLAAVWLVNYERPEGIPEKEVTRRRYARYWWGVLSDTPPVDPDDPWDPLPPDPVEPDPDFRLPMPVWKFCAFMMLAKYWIKRNGGANLGNAVFMGNDESL